MRIETQDIHWLKSPAFFGSTEKVWNSFEGFEIKSNEIKVLLNQFNSERLVLGNIGFLFFLDIWIRTVACWQDGFIVRVSFIYKVWFTL